jgi:hypothetical protein
MELRERKAMEEEIAAAREANARKDEVRGGAHLPGSCMGVGKHVARPFLWGVAVKERGVD